MPNQSSRSGLCSAARRRRFHSSVGSFAEDFPTVLSVQVLHQSQSASVGCLSISTLKSIPTALYLAVNGHACGAYLLDICLDFLVSREYAVALKRLCAFEFRYKHHVVGHVGV